MITQKRLQKIPVQVRKLNATNSTKLRVLLKIQKLVNLFSSQNINKSEKSKFNNSTLLTMPRDLTKKILVELLRNSKESDRNLAKKLRISQPTLTRIRRKLERDGVIRQYTFIPDFRKIGLEILAFTFVKMNPKIRSEELMSKIKEYAAKFSNVIYASTGEGMSMTGVIISLHKDYRDYVQKLNLFRSDWGEYIHDLQSFVTVAGEGVVKELSLKYIEENLL
jgi:DNA-binding Lrp family transcriptional regulator